MTPEAERYREQLRAMLPKLAERFGVSELGLFGSRVRGDHRPDSDLDVLVTFRPDARPSLFTLSDLVLTLEERLGVSVELALKENLKPRLRPHILREEVRV
ncbi:MAG TPA: nucleotidyltransferase family protein [Fimbriiglobus sp.]|jgi:predicted nucleotidyltransferase|nr:nucleotidyltransferase family protein [Fimbriiglobus sp.]